MTTSVMIRLFKEGQLYREELHVVDGDKPETVRALRSSAAAAATELGDVPHLVEMEWLDEPDPFERFFRFGTDKRGMVAPYRLTLGDLG